LPRLDRDIDAAARDVSGAIQYRGGRPFFCPETCPNPPDQLEGHITMSDQPIIPIITIASDLGLRAVWKRVNEPWCYEHPFSQRQ